MQLIHGESDLEGTKWVIEDVINLQTRLTDMEYEEIITPEMDDMTRLKKCSSILNKREALPAKYQELVKDYKGSKKADPDVAINL